MKKMMKTYQFTDDERDKSAQNLKELLKGNKKIWVNVHHKTKSYRWAYQLFLVYENKIIDCTRMVMIIMNGKIKNENYLYGSPDNVIDFLSNKLFGNYSEIEMNRL
jgi:hypothetical protein